MMYFLRVIRVYVCACLYVEHVVRVRVCGSDFLSSHRRLLPSEAGTNERAILAGTCSGVMRTCRLLFCWRSVPSLEHFTCDDREYTRARRKCFWHMFGLSWSA